MTNPNWGLAYQGNFQNALATGLQIGGALRNRRLQEEEMKRRREAEEREREGRNALATYATAPNDDAFAAAVQYDPRAAMAVRGDHRRDQAAQAQAERQRLADMAKLTRGVVDQASYQQALNVAQQLGVDVSQAPPQYDPQWIEQQARIFEFFADDKNDLPGIARELQQAGYEPGTPEFQEAMKQVINSKYASDYVDQAGNTRRRSVLNLGGSEVPQVQEGATATNPQTGEKIIFRNGAWQAMGGTAGNGGGGFP